MAENKKSFILYCDIIHTVNKLSDSDAGELFKHILKYVNDEDPIPTKPLISIAFEPIKQSLKRDLVQWRDGSEARTARAKRAGLASGQARKKNRTKRTRGNSVVQNELGATKRTVSDSVSVSVSVSDSVKEKNTGFLFFVKTFESLSSRKVISLNERRKKYLVRRKIFSAAQLLDALQNMFKDNFMIENNHATIDYILRNDQNVEKYINYKPVKTKAEKGGINLMDINLK